MTDDGKPAPCYRCRGSGSYKTWKRKSLKDYDLSKPIKAVEVMVDIETHFCNCPAGERAQRHAENAR